MKKKIECVFVVDVDDEKRKEVIRRRRRRRRGEKEWETLSNKDNEWEL